MLTLRPLAFVLAALGAVPLTAAVAVRERVSMTEIMATRERCALDAAVHTYSAIVSRDPADAGALKALGIAHHDLAVQDVGGAAMRAVAALQRAHALVPGDPEVIAYLGSARTLVARDSWNPFSKLAELREGTALIDRAVDVAPESVTVRLVRANSRLRLPAFLDRADDARGDLERIVTLAACALPCALLAEVHFKLAQEYRARNDGDRARAEWTRALRAAPESAWGRAARQRLGS
jgi:tetratricopeptide (TPR) repeat protein